MCSDEIDRPGEPDSWSYGLHIPHDPRAVGVVRATLRSILRAARLDCITDTVELLASELVTNAYRYAGTDAYVSMDRSAGGVRVSVWDTSPVLPEQRVPGDGDEGGRGLPLVAACSDAWGVDEYGAGDGKAVWFRLGTGTP